MPSQRRLRVIVAIVAIVVCSLFYFSVSLCYPLALGADPSKSTNFPGQQDNSNTLSSSEFYSRTVAAMDRESQASHPHGKTPAKHDSSIHEANQAAADGKFKEPPPIPPVKGQEHEAVLVAPADKADKPDKDAKGVAGRKKYKGGEHWDVASGKQAPIGGHKPGEEGLEKGEEEKKEEVHETEAEHEVEMELNSILKKGPIIIFSKSYCPSSQKAKTILLEKYLIIPSPYVVELDQHRLGPGLQAALQKSTGRRTVPNVLINGKSIGGGDDVQKLDEEGGLVGKVKGMGGKRIVEAKLRGSS